MAERRDLPRIIPDKRPSIFNREMADGAIWGSLLSLVALFSKSVRNLGDAPLSLMGAAIGGIIGGMHGKKREEREQIEGKVVSDPTLVNDGMLGGLALGMAGADIADIVKPEPTSRIGLGVRLAAYIAPGIIGGIIGKQHMNKELRQAEAAKAEALQQVLATPLPAPAFKDSVTLEDIVRLEAQKKAMPKSHATTIATARDEAAQQPTVMGV